MKKFYSFIFIFALAILAITPLVNLGGGDLLAVSAQQEENVIPVSSQTDLQNIAKAVNADENRDDYSGKIIQLTKDITLSGDWTPIGSDGKPFKGTFDGQGKTISNVSINGDYTYQGLFGYTSGATIKNLNVAGEFSSTFSSKGEVYAGVLVGYGVNTTISNCEVNAKSPDGANMAFNRKVTFGAVAGKLEGSNLSNTLAYMPINIGYDLLNAYTLKIGGVVGFAKNSNFTKVANFADVDVEFNGESEPAFVSNVYVGGLIGEIDGSMTKIKDCVAGGSIDVADNYVDNYKVGSVVGNVLSAPVSGNISSVAYYGTTQIFGDQGGYSFVNIANNDNVMRVTRAVLYAQEFYSSATYSFNLSGATYVFSWNEDTAFWDFEDMYVMVANENVTELRLQLFQKFDISLAAGSLDRDGMLVINGSGTAEDVPYGDWAILNFTFNDQIERNYYQISDILLNNTSLNYSQFTLDSEGEMVSPNGEIKLKIDQSEGATNFVLSVKSTSQTEGVYSFALQAIDYQVYVVAGENGKVRYSGTSNLNASLSRTLSKASSQINIEAVSDLTYAFQDWSLYYLTDSKAEEELGADEINFDDQTWKKASWSDAEQSRANPLAIQFATGNFVKSFLLYANFVSDPCEISFTFDNQLIQKISVNEQVLTASTDVAKVDKNQTVSIKIYVDKNSQIDEEKMTTAISSYFANQASTILTNSYQDPENSDLTIYEFSFSSSAFDYTSSSAFNITVSVGEKVDNGSDNTIWIIIGVVGGVTLLAVVAIIVWFVLRRRGGGGGSAKTKSDDYKRYYY